MRLLLGMIVGAFLTVGAAYLYDSQISPTTTGTAGNVAVSRPMVNWEVVGENWQFVRKRARDAWSDLSHKVMS